MTIRGMVANAAGTALFMVKDTSLISVSSSGARTTVGTLLTRRGTVGMKIGLTQLVVTDGSFR